MDPSFEQIFDDLYNLQSGRDFPDRDRVRQVSRFESNDTFSQIRETIDNADRRLLDRDRLRLRSDARFFLLINLTEMVARPIRMRTAEPPFAGPSVDLDGVLRGDLDLLLSFAARSHIERQRSLSAGRAPDPEISGHSVVEALAANWTRLKLNSYRIWGER
jgi:hypothetical protein